MRTKSIIPDDDVQSLIEGDLSALREFQMSLDAHARNHRDELPGVTRRRIQALTQTMEVYRNSVECEHGDCRKLGVIGRGWDELAQEPESVYCEQHQHADWTTCEHCQRDIRLGETCGDGGVDLCRGCYDNVPYRRTVGASR